MHHKLSMVVTNDCLQESVLSLKTIIAGGKAEALWRNKKHTDIGSKIRFYFKTYFC